MHPQNVALRLEQAVAEVGMKVLDIQRSIVWDEFHEYLLFRELASCILGSRVMFELATSATRRLDRIGLLRRLQKETKYRSIERLIVSELKKPNFLPRKKDGTKRSYVFPRLRASQIRHTAQNIYGSGGTLRKILGSCSDEYEARIQLVARSEGIGPKQASLFLRNIGYTDELAILDSHVLSYMKYIRLIRRSSENPCGLPSYERAERRLQDYAQTLKMQMSCLDTAIWIVMRVYNREFAL